MKPQVKLCPVCRKPLNPGDYVASKYPNGYNRKISRYDPNREGIKWYCAGSTCSNTQYFRCGSCGANVQIETFERITKVE